MGVIFRVAIATATKTPTSVRRTVHLRLMRTRRYSRKVDSWWDKPGYAPVVSGRPKSLAYGGWNSRTIGPLVETSGADSIKIALETASGFRRRSHASGHTPTDGLTAS